MLGSSMEEAEDRPEFEFDGFNEDKRVQALVLGEEFSAFFGGESGPGEQALIGGLRRVMALDHPAFDPAGHTPFSEGDFP